MRPEDLAPAADPLAPDTTMMLPVGDGHSLYVETVGDPDRPAAVFLHGGPGSGCQPAHRALFDPTRFHAVLFDQRGAGRSTPHRSRIANTTAHQVADMEAIRRALGIERWLVVGGSWGATLALAYAEAHPQRVTGLVLRATFLGTAEELHSAFVTSPAALYPELHADFLDVLPRAERADPLAHYWRRILDPDPTVHRPAAIAWHDTERVLSLARAERPRLDRGRLASPPDPLPSTPFMEAHYFANGCFLRPGQLLSEARALTGISGVIVQGEHDHLCPPGQAQALASIWPDADVQIIAGAGHALSEPAIERAVKAAIAHFA
jgi:proline iminopeptidase